MRPSHSLALVTLLSSHTCCLGDSGRPGLLGVTRWTPTTATDVLGRIALSFPGNSPLHLEQRRRSLVDCVAYLRVLQALGEHDVTFDRLILDLEASLAAVGPPTCAAPTLPPALQHSPGDPDGRWTTARLCNLRSYMHDAINRLLDRLRKLDGTSHSADVERLLDTGFREHGLALWPSIRRVLSHPARIQNSQATAPQGASPSVTPGRQMDLYLKVSEYLGVSDEVGWIENSDSHSAGDDEPLSDRQQSDAMVWINHFRERERSQSDFRRTVSESLQSLQHLAREEERYRMMDLPNCSE